ncbi:hypothetical protein E4P82_18695 [Candidatus Competibacter phosphatis]|uniref:Band 7 domain-containing protein n=1 Tax=Candidatus Competibacter phosphatis TaxID=221280 RepID=A0ABX1TNR3_9GAMM|nr:hypothetical protein [Candidatus Competibacter phosphatis]NMQ21041.1 hypothetical protein [Candidatus Competibacter phosphatis]
MVEPETYNPILGEEDLSKRGWLKPALMPKPGEAFVFSGPNRPLLTCKQGERTITWGESRWTYKLAYRVDVTEHPLRLSFSVPSKNELMKFHVEIAFRCLVDQPQLIVERNITDVAQWLISPIEDVIRPVGRDCEIKDTGDAERKMKEAVIEAVSENGFKVIRVTCKASPDEEAIAQLKAEAAQTNYVNLIETGDIALLAHYLVGHREEAKQVLDYLTERERLDRAHGVTILETLLRSNAIEGWQLESEVKRLLQGLLPGLKSSVEKSVALPGMRKTSNGEPPETALSIAIDTSNSDENNLEAIQDKKRNRGA